MVANQAYLFLIFTFDGIIIGMLFDFFRILRKTINTKDFVTYIQDFIFWILTGLIILYSIFTFNNGEIRIFLFIAIIIGIILYILIASPYVIKVNVCIINILKKFFFKPISFCIINIRKFLKNGVKILSKNKNNSYF